jgi:two-component system, OmpR family, response regulator
MAHAPRGVVLVVEDHADTRDLCSIFLEQAGFRCLPASTISEALAHLAAERIDVVVLDLSLPRLEDGLSFAWRVKASAHPPAMIAVTGHPPERIPGNLFAAYFMKPVEPGVIVQAVTDILEDEDSLA